MVDGVSYLRGGELSVDEDPDPVSISGFSLADTLSLMFRGALRSRLLLDTEDSDNNELSDTPPAPTSSSEKGSLLMLVSVVVGCLCLCYVACTYELIKRWCCGRFNVAERQQRQQQQQAREEAAELAWVQQARQIFHFTLTDLQRRAILEAIFSDTSKPVTDSDVKKRKKKKVQSGDGDQDNDERDVPQDVEIPAVSTAGSSTDSHQNTTIDDEMDTVCESEEDFILDPESQLIGDETLNCAEEGEDKSTDSVGSTDRAQDCCLRDIDSLPSLDDGIISSRPHAERGTRDDVDHEVSPDDESIPEIPSTPTKLAQELTSPRDTTPVEQKECLDPTEAMLFPDSGLDTPVLSNIAANDHTSADCNSTSDVEVSSAHRTVEQLKPRQSLFPSEDGIFQQNVSLPDPLSSLALTIPELMPSKSEQTSTLVIPEDSPYGEDEEECKEEIQETLTNAASRKGDGGSDSGDENVAAITQCGAASLLQTGPLRRVESFTTTTSEYTYDDDSTTDNLCPICLCSYKVQEVLIVSKYCSHRFHKDCIIEWLQKHDECPICRTGMVTDTEMSKMATSIVGQSALAGVNRRPVGPSMHSLSHRLTLLPAPSNNRQTSAPRSPPASPNGNRVTPAGEPSPRVGAARR